MHSSLRDKQVNKKSVKYNTVVFWLFLVSMLAAGCHKNTEADPCNPEAGRFIAGWHYIAGDLLTEERRWDYLEWNEFRKRKSNHRPHPGCIPIEYPEPLPQRIEKHEKVVDLER